MCHQLIVFMSTVNIQANMHGLVLWLLRCLLLRRKHAILFLENLNAGAVFLCKFVGRASHIRTGKPSKQVQHSFTLKEKTAVVVSHEKGAKVKELAEKFERPLSTIYTILKD